MYVVHEVSALSATEEERKCFETFAKWYLACLLSLKKEHELWCSTDVAKICPFAVDRAVAEQVLLDQPAGTFLVRISSEPGCFVLSIKVYLSTSPSSSLLCVFLGGQLPEWLCRSLPHRFIGLEGADPLRMDPAESKSTSLPRHKHGEQVSETTDLYGKNKLSIS